MSRCGSPPRVLARATEVIEQRRARARSLEGIMMSRRAVALLLTLALGLLAAPLAAEAEPAGKVWRIGFLAARGPIPRLEEAFRQVLRELGYVEGNNLIISRRYAEGRFERLPELAAELVQLKVDLILSIATPPTEAARKATATIPIVFISLADPVGQGVVTSLARPGRNITGFSLLVGVEVVGKRLELLKEVVPNIARVAVVWNPTNPGEALSFTPTQAAARELGLALKSVEVRDSKELEGVFAQMPRDHVDAVLVFEGPLALTHMRKIVALAEKHRLPAMYGFRDFVEAGGLMAYATDWADLYRRAATYVDKILKGAKPGDLPVQRPTRYELVINLKTARTLGLTIPQSVLIRADQVIE